MRVSNLFCNLYISLYNTALLLLCNNIVPVTYLLNFEESQGNFCDFMTNIGLMMKLCVQYKVCA